MKTAEEYCWATTQAPGRSLCGRSGSTVLESGFQSDSVVYAHVFDHLYSSKEKCTIQ